MFRRLMTRFNCWRRSNYNYRSARRISEYRATSTAEKLFNSGSLQSSKFTGNPLARDCK
jgi:hypothetical protein